MPTDDITSYLTARRQIVDAQLTTYLTRGLAEAETLRQAMRYSLLAGGKRIRPILALAACEAVGGTTERALPAAIALEMIHTYSLIHDDLPAMDNDDLRRGQPTCHKKFGEATAILAGDALLTEAFFILAKNNTPADVIADIADAAGHQGMAGGQAIDLASEGKKLSRDTLETLHRAKTGRLIEVSVTSGAKLGGAQVAMLDALKIYGQKIGLAFQIADDILNETGGAEEMGKSVGSDKEHSKATYPAVMGLETSSRLARQLIEEAVASLSPLGGRGTYLAQIAGFVVERRH